MELEPKALFQVDDHLSLNVGHDSLCTDDVQHGQTLFLSSDISCESDIAIYATALCILLSSSPSEGLPSGALDP